MKIFRFRAEIFAKIVGMKTSNGQWPGKSSKVKRFACFCVDFACACQTSVDGYQIVSVEAEDRILAEQQLRSRMQSGSIPFLVLSADKILELVAQMEARKCNTAIFAVVIGAGIEEIRAHTIVLVNAPDYPQAETIAQRQLPPGFLQVMPRDVEELLDMANDLLNGTSNSIVTVEEYMAEIEDDDWDGE